MDQRETGQLAGSDGQKSRDKQGSGDGRRTYDDQGRKIGGQGEDSFASSGWTFNCIGSDKDEGGLPMVPECNLIPPPLPVGVTKGTLLSASLPIASYQVSGEYSAIKFASKAGALNEKDVVFESIMGFKRAGASLIVTYFAKQIAIWL